MKKIVLLFLTLVAVTIADAQPTRRLQEQQAQKEAEKSPTAVTISDRARSQYTAQTAMPTEVQWRRDIYRELDLKKEKNAALYYPEEPLGDRVNFFTLLLNLILDGKITAYECRLDGNELFTPDNVLDIENMLDKFYIDYTKENGKYVIKPKDIPNPEKYFIKESNYLDQLSNYQTRVTAICPVMMDSEFGEKPIAQPMFWLNYDEISPYLGQTQVMTSSYNNTSNMSLDDYFVMRQYEGEIYKTSNLRNVPLSEYCETEEELQAERARIEKQLKDFQNGLWSEADLNEGLEPQAKDEASDKKQKEPKEPKEPKEKKEKAPRAPRQTASSGERLSVH